MNRFRVGLDHLQGTYSAFVQAMFLEILTQSTSLVVIDSRFLQDQYSVITNLEL